MLFTEYPLDDRLQRALANAEFVTPTPIQAAALPVAMDRHDLVGTAQTGTGKTAAFVLPILQRLIAVPAEARKTRAVILAPTRELVEQILALVRELGIHTNTRAVAIYGGVAMQPQTRALRNGVEIVVACPGRLLDHINRRNTDFRQVDTLVLDEADRMLDMGFMPSIQDIIDYLPAKRQTMLFSATFAKALNAFVKETLNDPKRIEVDTAVPAQTVRHTLYQVKHSMKTIALTNLLHHLAPESDSVLIFTRTRLTANQVVEHLTAAGLSADVLHSEKTQRARQDTLDQFRAGIFPYLVATDIAARGIDVTSISHVINFDLPEKSDDYLHRIGRTGRMERAGHAISLATRGDARVLRDIERMLGKKIEVARLAGGEQQQMSDPVAAAQEGMARPAKFYKDSRVTTHRPSKPYHQQDAERPGKRYGEAVQSTVPTRKDLRLKKFGPSTSQPERPDRADRPHVDGDGTRAAEVVSHGAAGRERHNSRKFTGMASVAKYNRKHAAGKRQPGEVAKGPRPPAKIAPVQESASMQAGRPKRAAGRGR